MSVIVNDTKLVALSSSINTKGPLMKQELDQFLVRHDIVSTTPLLLNFPLTVVLSISLAGLVPTVTETTGLHDLPDSFHSDSFAMSRTKLCPAFTYTIVSQIKRVRNELSRDKKKSP